MSRNSAYLYLLFFISFFAVALGAMDSVLSSAYLPDILKSMGINVADPEHSIEGAWINFSFLAGGTVGGILFGLIADKLGRRSMLSLSLLLLGVIIKYRFPLDLSTPNFGGSFLHNGEFHTETMFYVILLRLTDSFQFLLHVLKLLVSR